MDTLRRFLCCFIAVILAENVNCNCEPEDYQTLLQGGATKSGVYTSDHEPLKDVCVVDVHAGAWKVIQRRQDGSENFFRTWADYREGFGKLDGEFWLGNKFIHDLTRSGEWELRVDIWDHDNNHRYAKYTHLHIGPESDNFRLHYKGYSGDAGDSLALSNGMAFSTKDRDNDLHPSVHCSHHCNGAWWYNQCSHSNLNGRYNTKGGKGLTWRHFRGYYYSLKKTEMKIRQSASGKTRQSTLRS